MTATAAPGGVRLGLRANLAQFTLLVAVNALVGGMLGQERTVLPLLADGVFHLSAYTAALTYILAFGATKAITNFFAGTWSDRYGRKPVLIAGWLIALPVPAMLAWGPTWAWIIAANVLLGMNQGLTWSTTVIMKIDLAGPQSRGLAMGFNEAAGYGAVAATAMATGAIAEHAGLRPEPFLLGAVYVVLALSLSTLAVRETRDHARAEAAQHPRQPGPPTELTTGQIARLTSFRDRALSAASQAGMVNNLNDALAWGIFPCSSPPTACPSPRSASLPRSTPPCGARARCSPAGGPTTSAANTSSQRACSCRPPPSPSSPQEPPSPSGPPPRSSSASAPRWSTQPSSPSSATSPTPPGAPAPSASTDCGATAASPSAHWSPESSPTPTASPPPSGPSPP